MPAVARKHAIRVGLPRSIGLAGVGAGKDRRRSRGDEEGGTRAGRADRAGRPEWVIPRGLRSIPTAAVASGTAAIAAVAAPVATGTSTAAAVAPTAAIAAAAAASTSPFLARTGLVDLQAAAPVILAVEGTDRLIGAVGHLDEAEAPRAVRVAIDDD